MTFHHFVKKYTRAVFIFIVIVMVVPLVLWGYMAPSDRDADAQELAGTIFQTVRVTKGQYNDQLARARASYFWKRCTSRMGIQQVLSKQVPEAKPEELVRIAWENIILLQDARDNGVVATDNDETLQIRDIFMRLTGGQMQFREEILDAIAGLFQTHPRTFREWIRDQATIEKLLDLATDATFADYEKVFDDVMKQQQMVRVSYATFDPKDYLREAKPVLSEEVAKYFEANKTKFRVPEKIQVSYLMAELETLKKSVPEPTEEEIAKHYADTKAEWRIPDEHKHAPGEEHRDDEPAPEPQYRPLAEVRDQVIDRKKSAAALEQARKIMNEVNELVGASKKDGKYPPDVFESIREKLKSKGVELVHDITTAFDVKHVDDIEKFVGKNSGLEAWGFEKSRVVGDISDKVTTDKGVVLFRLEKHNPAYDPDLTEQVRERIEKILIKEQLRRRASQLASNLVQEIGTRGLAAARLKYNVEWKTTPYFKVPGGDSGIQDRALGYQISNRIANNTLTLGKAETISGAMSWEPEKKDLTHVVYLDDVVQTAPENVDAAFKSSRERLDQDERRKARDRYVSVRVAAAEIDDKVNKKPEPKPEEKKDPKAGAPKPKIQIVPQKPQEPKQ